MHLRANDPRKPNPANPSYWTGTRRYRIRELARCLDCSPTTISGGLIPCHTLRQLVKEEPGTDFSDFCCEKYHPTKKTTCRNGRPQCLHWRTGALEHLYNEQILLVQKSSDLPRSAFHHIQVFRLLPLLTPAQVDCLHPPLQIRHELYPLAEPEKRQRLFGDG